MTMLETDVRIEAAGTILTAAMITPQPARGTVLVPRTADTPNYHPRARAFAQQMGDAGYATVLLDLLTAREETVDRTTARLRFDIGLLVGRLVSTIDWLVSQPDRFPPRIGLVASGTDAAAALRAAARRPDLVRAVVSRGGRPGLAGDELPHVKAPTLLVVGAEDHAGIEHNESVSRVLGSMSKVAVIPGASERLTEPGALEEVIELTRGWFDQHVAE